MNGVLHVGISGARGRMGRAVSAALDARDDVVVAARFDRGETPDLSRCDVVIDFSTPEASVELAEACAAVGGPALVIGSTGFTPAQLAAIEDAAARIAVVRSGNFSLGVNILIGLVERAAQRLDARDWDVEVLEAHHRRKVDAPSGTALMLGEAAARGRGVSLDQVRELVGLVDQPDRPCIEVRDIASVHLTEVRRKLLELQELERSLAGFVSSCDSACAGGAAFDCTILEDLAFPADRAEVLQRGGCCPA